jgi:cell division protein YceG involved in septum cleavage
MQPAQTDYLFFVSEGAARGRHRFSRTAADHALNVQQYRRAVPDR